MCSQSKIKFSSISEKDERSPPVLSCLFWWTTIVGPPSDLWPPPCVPGSEFSPRKNPSGKRLSQHSRSPSKRCNTLVQLSLELGRGTERPESSRRKGLLHLPTRTSKNLPNPCVSHLHVILTVGVEPRIDPNSCSFHVCRWGATAYFPVTLHCWRFKSQNRTGGTIQKDQGLWLWGVKNYSCFTSVRILLLMWTKLFSFLEIKYGQILSLYITH